VTTIAGLRAGLAANLTAAYPTVAVNQYVLADASPPVFEIDTISDEGIDYDLANARGLDGYYITVRAIVGLTTDQDAQITLDRWLDPAGVKAALEADKTLGGVAQNLRVEHAEVKPMKNQAVPNSQWLAAEWRVYIYAAGN